MNVFYLPSRLLAKPIKVLLVGAGGTGSRVLEQLVCLHRAIRAKGHPYGLSVKVQDMDVVSPSNIGRQAFYPCDVGQFKSVTLVNRANMALGGEGEWKASIDPIGEESSFHDIDIVIGAVDNRAARKAIMNNVHGALWLDFGNRSEDGQVVLGQIPSRIQSARSERLPHIGDLYPELVDPTAEDEDDTPSCSLAEALERQSLYINQAVSVYGMNILWNLLTKGEITVHGAFINLLSSTVLPLAIDPEEWARFGFKPRSRKRRKAS
ncbi:PRTRC system ThiF family protein [Acidovorax delafieldii]|uniref:PRTRC system ThiF family protein n=1 Tax=Acidovorax delafieldii TaxID=47920 RepID=UPI003ED10A08